MYPPFIFNLDEVGNLPIEPSCMLKNTNGFHFIVGHLRNGYHLSI